MTPTTQNANCLSAAQVSAIRAELATILASSHFVSSKRCSDLLEYVVTEALAGGFDNLTERFIGAKLFGRPLEYDTATDAIVRVRAKDLRHRLDGYSAEQKKTSSVRIVLKSGSYIPEFRFPAPNPTDEQAEANPLAVAAEQGAGTESSTHPIRHQWSFWKSNRLLLLIGGAVGVVLVIAGLQIPRMIARQRPVERFWEPILRDKGDILLCAGGNRFLQAPVPGFFPAGKEAPYPYFSLQTEVSVGLLSPMIERYGSKPQFRFAASTTLTDLHQHPVVLLNAFNNQWTLLLTGPLRFRFVTLPSHRQVLQDAQHPETVWFRDPTLPAENSDDYALIARFRDKTTDNWVVVLAGLGYNGTEAATGFALDEHYMTQLRNQLGQDFADRNIEVVLKVSVVDGKTGAPRIVAAYSW